MILSLLLLAATDDGGSIEAVFLQYGLIGAVALGLALYSRSAIKSTEERARRLEEENRRLYQIMADQMVPEERAKRLEEDNRRLYGIMADLFVPALTKAAQAVVDATAIMAEIRKRDEIHAAVEAAARKLRDDA